MRRFLLPLAILLALGIACFPQGIKKDIDVSYGTADGQKLLMDIFQPVGKSTSPRAAVVLVHGGGWSGGDKREFHELAQGVAAMGLVAFDINYRLVKETTNKWPAQLDDCQRAVRWVRAHAADYNIDPERIAAIGGSAGGHLVACLGTKETRDNSDEALVAFSSKVQCVVDMCGPTDLTDDFAPKVKEGAWCNEVVRALLGANPGSVEDKLEKGKPASPLFDVDAKSAPALVFHGKTDPIVPLDQSERYVAALQKAGVEAKLIVHNGGHSFDDTASLTQFIAETQAFLKKHLRL